MLDIPQESKVVLFLLYCYWCITKNLQACTDWTRFLLWGSLHNLEQPESSRGCHNLNPYRHRHYAPEGYSCYTLDKPQGINVLLFLLFLLYCYGCVYKKPHPPGTFKLTQPDKVFYFGVPHSLERPEDSRGCHNLNGQDSPGAGMLPRNRN